MREKDCHFFLVGSSSVHAPIYLPTYATRACNNVAALVDLVLSLAPRRFRCYRGADRRDNATLRGSRRRVLSHSHSCYFPRGPSLAVILEAKYEVHTSCVCISLSLSLPPSFFPILLFFSPFLGHRDLSRYILVSYKIPTRKDSLCRVFIHESHEL